MTKKITINLGGIDRELKFGTMGFFKHIGEIIQGDPLEFMNAIGNPKKQYDLIYACVYAGLKSNGIDIPELDSLVQDMTFDQGAEVIKVAQESLLGGNGQAGEKEAQMMAKEQL
jgi:hypothetical protein